VAQLFSLGDFAFMFTEPSSPFEDDQIPVIPEGVLAKTPKAQHRDDLATFDHRELSKMDTKALAAWQSQFEPDEAQWKLADHEWQTRRSGFTRKIAIAALIISFLSLVLSVWSYWHPHH